jgi:hypothetical protein
MNNYRDGSSVDIELPFVDENCTSVTPTSASYRVLSENNAEIVAETPIALTGAEISASVTIDSSNNTLTTGVYRALRVVELTMTTSRGIVSSFVRYIIESDTTIVMGENSFQTFNESLLLTMDMTNLDRWNTSTDRDKKASLIEAYTNISKLSFRRMMDIESIDLSRLSFHGISRIDQLDEDSLKLLEPHFYLALRKAQIAESNHILGGDEVGDKRTLGLMSETIGETSSMFRPGTPLKLPVSRRALDYLSGYVTWGGKLRRG